jgi:hypothetical protein
MRFLLDVPEKLDVCPLFSHNLTVMRSRVLSGKQVVFNSKRLLSLEPGKLEIPRIEAYNQTLGRPEFACWDHSQLWLAEQKRIPVSFREFMWLFPATVLADKDGVLHIPYMVFQTVEWVRSLALLQGVFPKNARLVGIEVFE